MSKGTLSNAIFVHTVMGDLYRGSEQLLVLGEESP